MKRRLVIESFPSRIVAQIARGKLESEGITSWITADDEGGMLPFALDSKGIELLVNEEDYDKAKLFFTKSV